MNQEERLTYLVDKFKEDSIKYRDISSGESYEEKRRLLRALMNIRYPDYMDPDVLMVQDEFLRQEAMEKGIVSLKDIPTLKEKYGCSGSYSDKLSIWQGDITRLQVDTIVNAANSQMLGCFVPNHKCIDNEIHSASGVQLRNECFRQMELRRSFYGEDYEEPTGQAMITEGFNLPSKYVIHTVGPIVRNTLTEGLKNDLRSSYESVLKCSKDIGIRTLAFCCISTGEFRFPNDIAAQIAIETVVSYLKEHVDSFDRVIFNVFKDIDKEIYENLILEKYCN